jgi:hypothetical protein
VFGHLHFSTQTELKIKENNGGMF